MRFIVLLFLAISSLAFSQVVPAYSYHYDWDTNASVWDTTYRFDFSYTTVAGQPRVEEEVVQRNDNGTWFPDRRVQHGYDTTGHETSIQTEVWNPSTSAYTVFSRYELAYDSQGNLTRELMLSTNSFSVPIDTSFCYLWQHSYNGLGQLEETLKDSWDSILRQFFPEEWKTYSYRPSGERDSLLTQVWVGGVWRDRFLEFDYVWIAPDSVAEYLVNDYGIALIVRKKAFEYTDAFGSLIQHDLSGTSLTTLDSVFKTRLERDSEGNLAHQTVYRYDTDSNAYAWELEALFEYNYMVAGELTEYIARIKDSANGIPQNQYRITYHDFPTGHTESKIPPLTALWAPHPVEGAGRLLLNEKHPGSLHLEVFDLTGRKLKAMESSHLGGDQVHHFDLGLPTGAYLYRIQLQDKELSGHLWVK